LYLGARRTKKARKVLAEFELKNKRKLRIDVHIWGDKKYAEKLGYYGNIVYKPVLVDKEGNAKWIYPRKKGLPTMSDLENLYNDWFSELACEDDRERLRYVANNLYELAKTKIYLDSRKAHVLYQLLQIARRNPVFEITREMDVEDLKVDILPVIMVSFKGYRAIQPIKEYVVGTKFIEIPSIINKYRNKLDKLEDDLKHDLLMFAGKGIRIDLDNLSDWFKQGIQKAFLNETEQSQHNLHSE
jgi:hypothetical protein